CLGLRRGDTFGDWAVDLKCGRPAGPPGSLGKGLRTGGLLDRARVSASDTRIDLDHSADDCPWADAGHGVLGHSSGRYRPVSDWHHRDRALASASTARPLSAAAALIRCLFRRALGQNPLQRAPVHVEAARSLRDVAVAQLVDTLDMLPAHAV